MILHGSEEVRRTYLSRVAAGDLTSRDGYSIRGRGVCTPKAFEQFLRSY